RRRVITNPQRLAVAQVSRLTGRIEFQDDLPIDIQVATRGQKPLDGHRHVVESAVTQVWSCRAEYRAVVGYRIGKVKSNPSTGQDEFIPLANKYVGRIALVNDGHGVPVGGVGQRTNPTLD